MNEQALRESLIEMQGQSLKQMLNCCPCTDCDSCFCGNPDCEKKETPEDVCNCPMGWHRALHIANHPDFQFLPGMLVEQSMRIRLIHEKAPGSWDGNFEYRGKEPRPASVRLPNEEDERSYFTQGLYWFPVLTDAQTYKLIKLLADRKTFTVEEVKEACEAFDEDAECPSFDTDEEREAYKAGADDALAAVLEVLGLPLDRVKTKNKTDLERFKEMLREAKQDYKFIDTKSVPSLVQITIDSVEELGTVVYFMRDTGKLHEIAAFNSKAVW